jgi:hypothetical protein
MRIDMNCPKCNEPVIKKGTTYQCDKFHYWRSQGHITAYEQAQESLSNYLESFHKFTSEIGNAVVGDADDEIVQYMGQQKGKMFCGVGTSLPHIKMCPLCAWESDNVAVRRLNTAYVDEISNWMISCQDCFDDTVFQYDEMWKAYYSSCM